jgi:prepilin-type N-terminal cleavage/methylation domain-containing protein
MKTIKSMKGQQSGFTLVEIAIVLVIIGLLLGGILKGQELINSAKVKNLATDFKNAPLAIYGYQDRFRAVPGDDLRADANLPGATIADRGDGNGRIDGEWNSQTATDESAKYWRAVRLANYAAGPTDMTQIEYYPINVEGGRIGLTGAIPTQIPIIGMTGTYVFCSSGILGKFARQLDAIIDDNNTTTGSVRVRALVTGGTVAAPAAAISSNLTTTPDFDTTGYTVCMTF